MKTLAQKQNPTDNEKKQLQKFRECSRERQKRYRAKHAKLNEKGQSIAINYNSLRIEEGKNVQMKKAVTTVKNDQEMRTKWRLAKRKQRQSLSEQSKMLEREKDKIRKRENYSKKILNVSSPLQSSSTDTSANTNTICMHLPLLHQSICSNPEKLYETDTMGPKWASTLTGQHTEQYQVRVISSKID